MIYTELYNGYKIEVHDDDTHTYYRDVVEQTGDNVQLNCDTRSLLLGYQECAPKNYTLRAVVDNMPVDRLFVGDYGSHSGIWLTNYKEITDAQIDDFIEMKMRENAQYYSDMDERREYILDDYRLIDVYDCFYPNTGSPDITIICKKDTTDEEVADHWKLADDYVRGNCYRLTISEVKTCEHCQSKHIKEVDSTSFIGDYMPEVEQAREMINNY